MPPIDQAIVDEASIELNRRQISKLAAGSIAILGVSAIDGVARSDDSGATRTAQDTPGVAPTGDDWIVHTEIPANREAPLPRLIENYVTPVDRFYVRSHAANPVIDPSAYRLNIDGMVARGGPWSLDELSQRFEPVQITATMTCAGNRRYEHSRTQTIGGVPWREGAIGNAVWRGYRLSDLLSEVGVDANARHVWFDGLDNIDKNGSTIPFGASIPIEKAMPEDASGDVGAILCTHMNGSVLTPDHGFPLRVVVPGYIGARSVKWLGRIRVDDRENPNHYQSTAYKIVYQASPIEWAERAAIYRFPINAAICVPTSGATISDGPSRVTVRGYALPPGEPDASISSVELSIDGGQRWVDAELIGPDQPLCWRLWRAELELPAAANQIIVRATDTRGNTQPERTAWNKKGYLYNAQHRVDLKRSER